jgi:hypothetical protein
MMVVMPTVFGFWFWAFKIFLEFLRQRRNTKLFFELQNKVLDKFGNAPEALEYLQSDLGRQAFQSAVEERTSPHRRILNAVQIGAVVCALAVGFLLVREMVPQDGAEVLGVAGVLGLCLGIGYLISAAAAYYLSKSWGLINGNTGRESDELGV